MTNVGVSPGPRKIAPPDDVRERSALRRVDYQDAFTVRLGDGVSSAEQWARELLESAPVPVRAFLRAGWSMFGAQLGLASSSAHVLGWKIGAREADWIRLEVLWKVGLRANLVVRVRPDSLVVATFVEHFRHASRLVRLFLIPVHLVALRYLVSRAARCPPAMNR
ncbi:hypothetical protein [Saccharopolyspora kobensis]|uniref:hypothetical protein n=1 Tax=Saccharopolyspora kobensis TaxID=146035 RepID=UPI00116100BB|nr:hypothetical protein [Saccharopolyspora kobensis]